MREITKTDTAEAVRYRVTGMDCSACAAKIEATARSVRGSIRIMSGDGAKAADAVRTPETSGLRPSADSPDLPFAEVDSFD